MKLEKLREEIYSGKCKAWVALTAVTCTVPLCCR